MTENKNQNKSEGKRKKEQRKSSAKKKVRYIAAYFNPLNECLYLKQSKVP